MPTKRIEHTAKFLLNPKGSMEFTLLYERPLHPLEVAQWIEAQTALLKQVFPDVEVSCLDFTEHR